MSIRDAFRVLSLCVVLGGGTLLGAPMNPKEIEELMLKMSRPPIAHTLPDDSENGDPADPQDP